MGNKARKTNRWLQLEVHLVHQRQDTDSPPAFPA